MLALFSVSAFAYPLNVTYNQSSGYGGVTNTVALKCTNSTIDNRIYCFSVYENIGSPFWSHSIVRYNETLNGSATCSLNSMFGGYNCPEKGLVVLNESYILFTCGNAQINLLNVSNISSGGNCNNAQVYTRTNTGNATAYLSDSLEGAEYSNGLIYTYKNGIWAFNSTKFYPISYSAYYPSSADWGYGAKFLTEVSIPSRTDNSTLYKSGSGYYSTNGTLPPINQFIDSTLSLQADSIQTLYGIGYGDVYGAVWSDFVKDGNDVTRIYSFDREHNRVYMVYWNETENYTISCDAEPDMVIGTKCVDANMYYTNDGCNVTYSSCPSNSYCIQTTPVLNATTDLIENYTDCRIKTMLGFTFPCFTVCYPDGSEWISNCVADECKVCDNVTYSVFTNRYWSTTPVTVDTYSITCVDKTTGEEVYTINSTGNQTTIVNMINGTGTVTTNPTSGTCSNSTGTCYNSACQLVSCEGALISDDIFSNPMSAVGLMIGSFFGLSGLAALNVAALVMTMLLSVGILVLLAKFAHVHGKDAGMITLIMSAMFMVMFTVLQWLNPMIMLVLIILDSFVLAKMLRLT